MIYTDVVYSGRLSTRVLNFKQKGQYLWNFSCDICGDMSKGRQKARGFLYRNREGISYKCHHCGASMSLGNYLKLKHPDIYRDYVVERYQANVSNNFGHNDITKVIKTPDAVGNAGLLKDKVLDDLTPVLDLPETHKAVKFLVDRQIPRDKWNLIYYSRAIKKFTNKLIPNKFPADEDGKLHDEARLVFPYFTNHGKVFAYSARTLEDRQPKYYTIKLDETERIYGLDRVDYSKPVFAVEGQIDSLFLPNSIAVSGSSFDMPTLQALKSNLVIVGDNEPRSREIVKILHKNIKLGYKVCMLPHSVKEKDINDMILAGRTIDEVVALVNENTFQGLAAEARFMNWKLTNEKAK